jgi:DNA-binding transcriptional MocR family regulator
MYGMITPELTETGTDWESLFAGRSLGIRPSEIRGFLRLLENPDIISFAGGIPDPALFPLAEIQASLTLIMSDPSRRELAFQYAASEGYEPLRRWIVSYMARRNVACDTGNILITVGSQQALDLVGKVLTDPGDTILATSPAYLGAIQAFTLYQPKWDTIALEGPLAREMWRSAKLAYLVPEFSNPDGETMPEAERRQLLDLARESSTPVVEDAAYEALRFEGAPESSLLALDIETTGHIDRSRVIYAGTFSKTIAPGLRVGWICAAKPLIEKAVLARQAADLHGSMLDQMIVHDVVATSFDQQVSKIIPVYRKRRDAMLAALAESMPAGVTWKRPEGGMFIWLTLPEGMDSRDLLRKSLESENVIFVPGTSFHPDQSGERHIRLNFSRSDEATVTDGIHRLARLIACHLPNEPGGPTWNS